METISNFYHFMMALSHLTSEVKRDLNYIIHFNKSADGADGKFIKVDFKTVGSAEVSPLIRINLKYSIASARVEIKTEDNILVTCIKDALYSSGFKKESFTSIEDLEVRLKDLEELKCFEEIEIGVGGKERTDLYCEITDKIGVIETAIMFADSVGF